MVEIIADIDVYEGEFAQVYCVDDSLEKALAKAVKGYESVRVLSVNEIEQSKEF